MCPYIFHWGFLHFPAIRMNELTCIYQYIYLNNVNEFITNYCIEIELKNVRIINLNNVCYVRNSSA